MSGPAPSETHIIVAAAGQGTRLGGDIPKQYQKLHGKSLLRHTLDKLLQVPNIASIRVIIGAGQEQMYQDAIKGLDLPPPIIGGNIRKESIYNALQYFSNANKEHKILFHDAARPFVSVADIIRLIEVLDTHEAATLACPVSDTLNYDDGTTLERNGLWAIQTPQGFHLSKIKAAHEALKNRKDFTDDTALIREMGGDVLFLSSSRLNYKITTQEDWDLAMQLLKPEKEIRTGQGFDVHAFKKEPASEAVICGVRIPSPYALEGHSDADVGLHAITDALLGAMGEGDIGQHFPPSEAQWKNADSALFLSAAHDMLRERGGEIINIDITIICEQPKIGPYREAMQARVAEILNTDTSRVNIKATTTEKLGFLGREEGIAAQALANIRF